MISLRKFLYGPSDTATPAPAVLAPGDAHDFRDAVLRVLHLLLEGLLFHLVRGSEEDWKLLDENLRRVLNQMDANLAPMQMVELGADALLSLEQYNQHTAEYFQRQREEYQAMLAMLTETVASISTGSRRSVSQLEEIEKQIECASATDDMSRLKATLGECLGTLREEAVRQKEESSEAIGRIQEEIEHAATAAISNSRGKTAAARQTVSHKYAGVFVIHRLDLITARFGDSVRYQLVERLGQHLKQRLGNKDRLLRWKGGSYLVFIERTATFAEVEAELDRISHSPGDQHFDIAKRSILLPLAFGWTVLDMERYPSLAELFTEVDHFADFESTTAAKTPGFHPWAYR